MSDYLRELANEERKEKEHEAHYVARLEAKLAEFRDWPCENDGCEHTLGDVMAHDANHSEPTSGGAWFCAACWNRALGGLSTKLGEVTAERDEFVKSTKRLANSIDDERALTSAARRARDHFEAALAASQAHAVELRAALETASVTLSKLRPTMTLKSAGWDELETAHNAMAAALARESSTWALREFGLRVADECLRQASASSLVDGLAAVDAVLRGEHD